MTTGRAAIFCLKLVLALVNILLGVSVHTHTHYVQYRNRFFWVKGISLVYIVISNSVECEGEGGGEERDKLLMEECTARSLNTRGGRCRWSSL